MEASIIPSPALFPIPQRINHFLLLGYFFLISFHENLAAFFINDKSFPFFSMIADLSIKLIF